jgi:hypothetical protein
MICGSKCENCIYHHSGEDTCNFTYCIKEEYDEYDGVGNYKNNY